MCHTAGNPAGCNVILFDLDKVNSIIFKLTKCRFFLTVQDQIFLSRFAVHVLFTYTKYSKPHHKTLCVGLDYMCGMIYRRRGLMRMFHVHVQSPFLCQWHRCKVMTGTFDCIFK